MIFRFTWRLLISLIAIGFATLVRAQSISVRSDNQKFDLQPTFQTTLFADRTAKQETSYTAYLQSGGDSDAGKVSVYENPSIFSNAQGLSGDQPGNGSGATNELKDRGLLDSPTITITGLSNTILCVGNPVSISFTASGSALPPTTSFDVLVSDATGSFTNARKLASGTTSPLSFTLASNTSALPYGINYRFIILAPTAGVQSAQSQAIAIGDLTAAGIYDRLVAIPLYATAGTICPGSRTTLSVYPTNFTNASTSSETYQWTRNGDVIPGATSPVYSAQQEGKYRVSLQKAGCLVNSNPYILTLSTSPNTYVYSPETINGPQCEDRPLPLHSLYIGETASYQWLLNNTAIAGATNSTLAASQTGAYSFALIDESCNLTSSSSYYQFGRSLFARISPSTRYPVGPISDTLLCGGLGGTLLVNVNTASRYSIQWHRDGLPIPGATQNFYTVSQPGIYSTLLTQGNCQAFSNAVVISQTDQLKASIVSTFGTIAGCPDETHSLLAAPSVNASFQWQRDGVDIPGATQATNVPNTTGNYTVRITRGSCTAISEPISLTFSDAIQPTISTPALSGGSCGGMTLIANGLFNSGGYNFQWYKNGELINGPNSSGLYVAEPGAYSVRVTKAGCTGTSKEYYANVNSGKISKPIIAASSASQACANSVVSLNFLYTGGSIQWRRNGAPIAGASQNQVYATESGVYSVVLQNGSCQVESDPIQLTIGEAATAQLMGNAVISNGQTALLPVSFTGIAPWSLTLNTGESVKATYKNPTLVPVSPGRTTTYQLASVINGCGPVAMSGQAQVKVFTGNADLSLSMRVSDRTPKVDEPIEVMVIISNAGPLSAPGVQAQCRLPAGLAFDQSVSGDINSTDGVITMSAAALNANTEASFRFRVKATQAGSYFTRAQLTASLAPDPDSQPDSGTEDGQDDAAQVDIRTTNASAYVAVSANPNQTPLPQLMSNQPSADPTKADLSLSLSSNTLSPTAGEIISVTLTVKNRGGSSASSIKLQSVLPAGWSLADTTGVLTEGQFAYSYINQLPANQSDSIELRIRVGTETGQLRAQIIDMAPTDSDSTPGNGFDKGEDDEATFQIRIK